MERKKEINKLKHKGGIYNGFNKFYDVDLPFGRIFEEKLKSILGGKMEVKTERDIWKTTGNMCIELRCKFKESGINVTQADYWCHIFQDDGNIEMILFFPVDKLKKKIKELRGKGIGRIEYGGDNQDSMIALMPIKEMVN
jgi:hypothetical protein